MPTAAEAAADPSLRPATITDPSYEEVQNRLSDLYMTKERVVELANNVYKAHKKTIGMIAHFSRLRV